jgi:hypothetical protein
MKIKSKDWKNFQRRLQRFPQFVGSVAVEASKTRALGVRKTIQDGLRKSNLVRPALAPITIHLKRLRGYSRIRTPLMGRGGKGSMIEGLGISKVKNGFRLAPTGKHHSGLSQRAIWMIHELGATVRPSPRFRRFLASQGFFIRNETVFRIPARRPMRQGFNRYINSEAAVQTTELTARAVRDYLIPRKPVKSFL